MPRIREVDDEDIVEELDYDIDVNENVAERVERTVAHILASISSKDEEKDESLMKVLCKLITQVVAYQERASESIKDLKGDVGQLRAIVDRQRGVLYVVIAFLVWLSVR